MKRNFNINKQKMQNEFILRMQNKDDSNYSIAWSIKNTKLKNYPVLIYSEVGKYFAYVDTDEMCFSDFISCEIIYDKVINNFNILESEKPCLAKCMYDFSVKDLYTLDKGSDFAKFLVKYNFELHVESDDGFSRYMKYLNFIHYNI